MELGEWVMNFTEYESDEQYLGDWPAWSTSVGTPRSSKGNQTMTTQPRQ